MVPPNIIAVMISASAIQHIHGRLFISTSPALRGRCSILHLAPRAGRGRFASGALAERSKSGQGEPNSRTPHAPHPEQPGTWVTLLTGDMGNTFLVLFRSAAAAAPVDPVGNASSRCPQVHGPGASVCIGDRRRG